MKYEDLVVSALRDIYGPDVRSQVPLAGGYADAVIDGAHTILIEAKSIYCPDAYYQLRRYERGIGESCVKIAVVKLNDRSVVVYETPTYIQGLDNLLSLSPGYYIIPWSGRFRKRS